MSKFAAHLEQRADALFTRWIESLGPATAIPPELRSHVPGLLQELGAALSVGCAPESSASATAHGDLRQESGFDVEAVVREYRFLLHAILDSAEAEGLELTMAEVRIVTDFVSRAVAQGVAAHRRYEAQQHRVHEQARAADKSRAEAAHRRLESLFRSAPAFMAALQGPVHTFTLVNEPYQRLVGAARPLLGLPVAEALPEVVEQGFRALLDNVYNTGVAYVGRETGVKLDRGAGLEDAYVDFVYQPTRDAVGAVDGIDVFGFDVTAQVHARQRIEALASETRAQRAELELVVDALPVLVSFVTKDLRYGLVNKAYEQWFGVSREELRGRAIADVIGEKAFEQLIPFMQRALAGERLSIEQHDVPYALGGTRDIAATFVPRRTANGPVEGYVVVLDDITARRRFHLERERLFEAEREARREADLQREHLRTLVDTAPIGIATWVGPRHIFESANARYLGAFEKTSAILAQPLATALGELASNHALFSVYDTVYRTGEPFVDPEYRLTLQVDGEPRTKVYALHLTAVRDVEGLITGVMACILDVTEAVAFRELVEVERDLATAVASLEEASRHASDAARQRTEFLLSVVGALSQSLELDVMLQRLVEIIAPTHTSFASVWSASRSGPFWRRVHAPFRAELEDSETASLADSKRPSALAMEHAVATCTTLHVDDYPAWLTARGAADFGRAMSALGVGPALFVPIRRHDVVVAVLSLSRSAPDTFTDDDVALFESVARFAALAFENARLFSEMSQLRQVAEAATAAKDRFLAHVSHDLRNPLNSILGWSTLLRRVQNDPVQFLRGIDVIERNAKSQVQLIEDLLDVSRITSGKLALEFEELDVATAFETALDSARLAAAAKEVELIESLQEDIGSITVDPDRFRQIIWNLVSNAVKFTPRGGTVRIDAKRVGPTFELAVSDTGKGIAADFLPRMFTAFEQAEAGASRSGGLGLGLAIVGRLVELHGGTIRVESDGIGKGARFTMQLPIRTVVQTLVAALPAEAAQLLRNVEVLVVDDEEEAREVVKVILEHAGASVKVAGSADEALALLLESRPHVVLSDVGMPGKDGKALVRELRGLSEAQGGRIPAVALTAQVRTNDLAQIRAAGFDALVAKPLDPARLLTTLTELLKRR